MEIYKDLTTAIFYTCGTCNLKCRYCGIHKNPILKNIDEVLAKSFEGDYYFNRVQQYFPRKDMLTSFETWGGEPFIHMERLHSTLRKLIEYYPYFQYGYSSTNFSFNDWTNKFFGLMDVFGEYPNRLFHYNLQLSVDGPEEINDLGRGEGVTKRCIKNYQKLIELLKNGRLPKNIILSIHCKSTLDNATMKMLDTQEKIIEYYRFFEDNFIGPVHELNNDHIQIAESIPNTAVPSPVTVEDGKFFATLVKNCREIEAKNINHELLRYYSIITLFHSENTQPYLTYNYSCHTCGSGSVNIGFLPDNMVSSCHEGFTKIVEEYQKLAEKDTHENSTITFDKFLGQQKVSLCLSDEQYKEHAYKMALYNKDLARARLATNTAMIIALALAGQIEQQFVDESNALKAAIFLQNHTAYCIKDNYNKTGSYTLEPVGIYKLLLNGAMQYIQHDGELQVTRCNLC